MSELPDNSSLSAQTRFELQKLLADHSAFIKSRLTSFVGRAKELAEIEQEIEAKLATGGYVTISGKAGQGKSSVVASLVKTRLDSPIAGGQELLLAHHFIPFSPGADHQVELLRNLMARLILKYNLSPIYVASDSRASLRQMFVVVLKEVVARGGQEVIFIDGLDQLEHELTGERDLSFLPTNPPPGIVFVLGTRPDDTLKPPELLKPKYEYKLPELSRNDFELVLSRQEVSLATTLIDQFYQAMDKNALYLDLVARELASSQSLTPQKIIERVAANPENLFELAIDRLKHNLTEWEDVLKPVLGVLVATQEPLPVATIGQLLGLTPRDLAEAILKLGGLLAEDGQGRRYLYHLKLKEYLSPDPKNPEKLAVCDAQFLAALHAKFASFCEGDNNNTNGLEAIWQDSPHNTLENYRRSYARQHYVTHLYHARDYPRLFNLLDRGEYGLHKIKDYDPSTRTYALDLDLGRAAASREGLELAEGIGLLPNLWRYTLLRVSLASRVDNYPIEIFEQIFLAGREKECLARVELLTDSDKKIEILARLSDLVAEQARGKRANEAEILYLEAFNLAEETLTENAIENLVGHARFVTEPVWREKLIPLIENLNDFFTKSRLLCKVAYRLNRLGQTEQADIFFEQALAAAYSISKEEAENKGQILWRLAIALSDWGKVEQAKTLFEQSLSITNPGWYDDKNVTFLCWQAAKLPGDEVEQANTFFEQAITIIGSIIDHNDKSSALTTLIEALVSAGKVERALAVVNAIIDQAEKARVLAQVATALAQAGSYAQALATAHSISDEDDEENDKAKDLVEIAKALAEAGQFDYALVTANSTGDDEDKALALAEIAKALVAAGEFSRALALTDEALVLTNQAELAWRQSQILQEVALALANAHQFDDALALAEAIPAFKAKEEDKAKTLNKIAIKLIQVARLDQARPIWEKALGLTTGIPADRRNGKNSLLQELARALATAGNYEQAITLANSISETRIKTNALVTLAKTIGNAGDCEQAVEIANLLDNTNDKSQTLKQLVAELLLHVEEPPVTSLEQAVAIAHSIPDLLTRIASLGEIAKWLFQNSADKQALEIFGQALALTQLIPDELTRIDKLSQFAGLLSKKGYGDDARTIIGQMLATANAILDDDKKAKGLETVVESLIQMANYEAALEITKTIPEYKDIYGILKSIAGYFLQASQFDYALTILELVIDSPYHTDRILREVARALISAGNFEQALHTANSITDQSDKDETLVRLIEALLEAGDYSQVLNISKQVQETRYKGMVSRFMALALAQLGDYLKALEYANTVLPAYENPYKAEVLSQIAEILVQRQEKELAKTVFDEALRVASLVSVAIYDGEEDFEWLKTVTGILVRVGEAQQALEFVDSFDSDFIRVSVLNHIALTLAQTIDLGRMQTVFDQALAIATASLASGGKYPSWMLADIASSLIALEDYSQALEVANSIPNLKSKARALGNLVEVFVKVADYEGALAVAELIPVKEANRNRTNFRLDAYRKLSREFVIDGQNYRALEIVQKAWRTTTNLDTIPDSLGVVLPLLKTQLHLGKEFAEAFEWVENFLAQY